MAVELKVPEVGESIVEVQIAGWLRSEGDYVERDEPVAEIDSDKATFELTAPVSGTLTKLTKKVGESADVGEIIAYIEEASRPAKKKPPKTPASPSEERAVASGPAVEPRVMPAARRALAEQELQPGQVEATGPGGRLLKEDVSHHGEDGKKKVETPAAAGPPQELGMREVEEVPISPMRRRIAERLVEAHQTAAMLTTFNEIDMSAVMALRAEHQEAFHERYGVKLGIMSFFVKATVDALMRIPQLNAEIRDRKIIYHNYCDIGVAISSGKGLLVPVLRNAERMSFAELELAIADFAKRAQSNRVGLDELEGGTFTITNGGVFGSLLSTPIINPPQSGILGMHVIQDRPVACDGQVVIRPMMYIALTYDHRLVDGREAVSYLKRVKECIEAPSRLLLEV